MASETFNGYALIYGGSGALGSGCVNQFKNKNWWVASVEVWKPHSTTNSEDNRAVHVVTDNKVYKNQSPNTEADVNLLVNVEKDLNQQETELLAALNSILKSLKLNAIICVAGGYLPGAITADFVINCEKMWKQNIRPSILAARIASKFISDKGMLVLTGAKAALTETPSAIAYGLCKSAVHQLTKSLAHSNGGLPTGCLTLCLMPVTLDTVMNRQMMPTADISGWTPTKYITEHVYKWAKGIERPVNGSLVQFATQNFNTDITYL